MLDTLRRDAVRYRDAGGWWRHLGFWAVAICRVAAAARAVPVPGIRHVLVAVAWLLKQPLRLTLHLELPSRARIGPGFALFHPYNVLIGSEVVIGEGCSIYHEVTLGSGPVPGQPILGDHVVVFSGARVFGGIRIGDRSEIGANCVVTKDVPPYSLVVAALPRIIPQSLVPRAAPPAEGLR